MVRSGQEHNAGLPALWPISFGADLRGEANRVIFLFFKESGRAPERNFIQNECFAKVQPLTHDICTEHYGG